LNTGGDKKSAGIVLRDQGSAGDDGVILALKKIQIFLPQFFGGHRIIDLKT
jgi:hypothetical protein